MIVKLAALGALGYVGYRYLQNQADRNEAGSSPRLALAGGPLSDQARVQSDPNTPPAPSPMMAGDSTNTIN